MVDTRKIKIHTSTANVPAGAEYYRRVLLAALNRLFVYVNAPFPTDRLEHDLLKFGFVGVLKNEGEIVFTTGGLSGYDTYYRPTEFTPANPCIKPMLPQKIGEKCAVIYNNSNNLFGGSLAWHTVCRYAEMLAHADSTYTHEMINARVDGVAVAEDKAAEQTAREVFNRRANGDFGLVTSSVYNDSYRVLDSRHTAADVRSVVDTKREIFADFYAQFGIQTTPEKRERMVVEETEADMNLPFNVMDMLECRKEGIAAVNKIFGTEIEVYFRYDS